MGSKKYRNRPRPFAASSAPDGSRQDPRDDFNLPDEILFLDACSLLTRHCREDAISQAGFLYRYWQSRPGRPTRPHNAMPEGDAPFLCALIGLLARGLTTDAALPGVEVLIYNIAINSHLRQIAVDRFRAGPNYTFDANAYPRSTLGAFRHSKYLLEEILGDQQPSLGSQLFSGIACDAAVHTLLCEVQERWPASSTSPPAGFREWLAGRSVAAAREMTMLDEIDLMLTDLVSWTVDYERAEMCPYEAERKRHGLDPGAPLVLVPSLLANDLGNWRSYKDMINEGRRSAYGLRLHVPNAIRYVEEFPKRVRSAALADPAIRLAMDALLQRIPPRIADEDRLRWMAGIE